MSHSIPANRSDTMFSRVPITPNPNYFIESTNSNAPPSPSLDISSTTAAVTSSVSDSMASPLTDDLTSVNSDWWTNAIEEDSFYSPLPFDASESGLWNGRFVPPPPRPPFWDDTITSDGLTTCDLCTWALHDRNAFSLDGSISGEFLLFSNVTDVLPDGKSKQKRRRMSNQLKIVRAMKAMKLNIIPFFFFNEVFRLTDLNSNRIYK